VKTHAEPSPPLPPIELMRSVGPTDPALYDNPSGVGIFDHHGLSVDYSRVFDLGCGCGRLARMLMQQKTPPKEYLGVDLNPLAIAWSQENLSPLAPTFMFRHIDVYNAQFNPGGKGPLVEINAPSNYFSLVMAWSVFTHILQDHARYYMDECGRVTQEGGIFAASWFIFDKRYFPAMQEFQNCLYINADDPTNAVWYDRVFLSKLYSDAGFNITRIEPPSVRGYQYLVFARKGGEPEAVDFPEDLAPFGTVRIPIGADQD
jgi:SAM-dependent methyltransferase